MCAKDDRSLLLCTSDLLKLYIYGYLMLTQTAEPARAVLGVKTIEVVADKGYFKIKDIEACEKAGMVPFVPRPPLYVAACSAGNDISLSSKESGEPLASLW